MFQPFKSHGMDGVMPVFFQKGIDIVLICEINKDSIGHESISNSLNNKIGWQYDMIVLKSYDFLEKLK